MLSYLIQSRRWAAALVLVLWDVVSAWSALLGWAQLFSAMGSVALCLGFAVFLADRFRLTEERRLWDHDLAVQLRMMWRYLQRMRRGDEGHEPLSMEEIETRLTEGFENMIAAKNEEARLETYRLEMAISILGTLRWGFGALAVGAIHG